MNVPTLMAGFAAATFAGTRPTCTEPPPSGLANTVVTPCRTLFSAAGLPIDVLAFGACFGVRVHVDEAGRDDQAGARR